MKVGSKVVHNFECGVVAACTVLLGLVAGSGVAAAEESPTATLDYGRADSAKRCPDARAIRERVAARLGYDPFVADASQSIRVRLTGRVDQSGHAARIELHSPQSDSPGVRTLESSDPRCDELVDALVFTVTVAIDPSSTLGGGAREVPGDARRAVMAGLLRVHDAQGAARQRQAKAADLLEEVGEQPREEPAAAEPAGFDLRAASGGGLAVGVAPKPAGQLRLQVELGREHWSVGLGGVTSLPVQTSVSTGTMETSMLLAELTPCARYGWLRGCGLLVAGSLRTTGMELQDAASNAHLYAAAGLRAGVEVPVVGPLSVRVNGEFAAALARTRVLVGGEPVWRTPDLTAGVGGAVVFAF